MANTEPVTDSLADRLRPLTFDDYVGQPKLKRELEIRVKAALIQRRPVDDILLVGPAGSGKTTIAAIVATMLDVPYHVFDCPLNNDDYRRLREAWGVVFFDEVHRGNNSKREEIQQAVEHRYLRPPGRGRIDWNGDNAKVTFIAATTEPGKLSEAFKTRFMIQPTFEPYSDDEMRRIVQGMAGRVDLPIADADALTLGRAAAGVPRQASRLVTAARDLFVVTGEAPTAQDVLEFTRTTEDGLTPNHAAYLRILARNAPMGVHALADALGMDVGGVVALEAVLIRQDYVERTGRGRDLTSIGFQRNREINGL